MSKPAPLHGYAQLAIDGVLGVTAVVESMHATIARGGTPAAAASGLTGFVYSCVRGVTRTTGSVLKALLRAAPLQDPLPERQRAAVHAALNGVWGDHLARTRNPLAIDLALCADGTPLPLVPAALAAALPGATPHLLVLAHGLCMNDAQWLRNGHDHGAALASAHGYTPVYVRYNSGRAIAMNARDLARALERLVDAWPVPVERIALLGHSMGGLVLRGACAAAERAGQRWRSRVTDYVSLGTPHAGAPLERAGHAVERGLRWSAFSAPLAALGAARSAGIRDLREGRVAAAGRHIALPDGVRCYAVAATRARGRGDGLVPTDSALGRHADPDRALGFDPAHCARVAGADHFDLLDHPDVAAHLREWLAP